MKPYHEEIIDEHTVIRTFSPDVDEREMKWHWYHGYVRYHRH